MHVDEGRLQAYIDGELPIADRAALESHLATCDACRLELDELRRIGVELHAALVATDMVAGTVSAHRIVSERHAALGGAPAAANDIDKRRMRRNALGSSLRLARTGLLKAAALAALLVGAASAAMVDSPLREWLEDAWDRVTGDASSDGDVGTAPVAPPVVTPAPVQEPLDGFRFPPADGSAQIALRGLDFGAGTEVRVRLIDAPIAAVYAPPGANVQLSRSAGGLDVLVARGTGAGTYVVELPRAVARATVEVNGRVLFRKIDDELITEGARDAATDEYILPVHS